MKVRNNNFVSLKSRLRIESLESRRLLSADLIGPSFVSSVLDSGDGSQLVEQSTAPPLGYLSIDNSDISWHELDGTSWIDAATSNPSVDARVSNLDFSLTQSNTGIPTNLIDLKNGLPGAESAADAAASSGFVRPTIDIVDNRVSRFEITSLDARGENLSPTINDRDGISLYGGGSQPGEGNRLDGGIGNDSENTGQVLNTGDLPGPTFTQESLGRPEIVTDLPSAPNLSLKLETDSAFDEAPTSPSDELHMGGGFESTLITSTFGVEPNRGLAETLVTEASSVDSATQLIDISINKTDTARRTTEAAKSSMVQSAADRPSEFAVDSQPTVQHSTAVFRVEPMMARHHRIEFQAARDRNAGWTTSVNRNEGSVSLAGEFGSAYTSMAKMDADFLINTLQPASHTAARQQAGLIDDRLTTPIQTTCEQASAESGAAEAAVESGDASPSFWQNAVDLLMAGATGAMIYSQRPDDGKESRFLVR